MVAPPGLVVDVGGAGGHGGRGRGVQPRVSVRRRPRVLTHGLQEEGED